MDEKNKVRCAVTASVPFSHFRKYGRVLVSEENPDELWKITEKCGTGSLFCDNWIRGGCPESELIKKKQQQYRVYDILYRQKFGSLMTELLPWNGKFAFIKGIGIAYYGFCLQPGVRISSDYDILAEPDIANNIYERLIASGWMPSYSVSNRDDYNIRYMHHMTPLTKNGVYLEIHHRLTLPYDSYRPDIKRMLSRIQWMELNGCAIPILSIEDDFYAECLDMYIDQYYVHTYSLKAYAAMMSMMDLIDWTKLQKITAEDDCLFPVSYALHCLDYLYAYTFNRQLLSEKTKEIFLPACYSERYDLIRHHMTFSDDILGKWGAEFPLEKRILMGSISLNPEGQALFDRKIAHYFFRKKWEQAVSQLPQGYFDMYTDWEYTRKLYDTYQNDGYTT